MLAVSALTKIFGGFKAVSSVSFEVKEGEILGLIGPNGSGKSTTFNLIAGALVPTAGSISFLGRDIGGWPAYRVAHAGIGRTFQIPRPRRLLRTGGSPDAPTGIFPGKRDPRSGAPARRTRLSRRGSGRCGAEETGA